MVTNYILTGEEAAGFLCGNTTKFRVFEVLALKDLLMTDEPYDSGPYRYVVVDGTAGPNEGERVEEINPFVNMPLQWD